jgi:Tol biopolymer transport system component
MGLGRAILRQPAPEPVATQTTILPPENLTFGWNGSLGRAALSPNGRYVAFTVREPRTRIWIRPIDSLAARPLDGTEDGLMPFWAPDSTALGFFTSTGKLKRIILEGGGAVTLTDAPTARGGAWGSSGWIVFAPGYANGLLKIPAAGGTPQPATELSPKDGITSHRFPTFLPDGEHFMFMATSEGSAAIPVGGIQLASLASIQAQTIVEAGQNDEPLSAPVFATGHVLFLRANTLLALPLSERTWTVTGEQAVVTVGVSSRPQWGENAVSASDNGLLLFHTGEGADGTRLAWIDRSGKESASPGVESLRTQRPALSPDGTRAVAEHTSRLSATRQIWAFDLRTGLTVPVTQDPSNHDNPVWSPDGRWVAYRVARDGNQIARSAADGSAQEMVLASGLQAQVAPSDWSPNGELVLFAMRSGSESRIAAVSATGNGKPWDVVQSRAPIENSARFSPDGKWILYASNESGRAEVYAAPFSDVPGALAGGKIKISTDGGARPRWRRDGREIFYVAPDSTMTAIDVQLRNGALTLGAPRALFTEPGLVAYDVTADGQRFLASVTQVETGVQPLVLIQNWTRKLAR